jgi:predicted adenylyl cyclase CyaB
MEALNENREYEIVIQNKHITMDKLKEKIKSVGGEIVQEEKVFFHFSYQHPYKKNKDFIRLRNEGKHITLTYKIHNHKFPIEHEVVVNDFNSANQIINLLGCKKKYECHKLREIWKLEGCKEIVFDTYPGIEIYAEIECNSEENIISSLEKLELDTDISKYERLFASKYYKDMYGITQNSKEKLSFKTAYNVLLERATKNKGILKERLDIVNEKHKDQINLLE